MKIIFTIGISASGKSTWAEKFHEENRKTTRIVCRDYIRHQIAFERLQSKGYDSTKSQTNLWRVWNFKFEKEVTELWMNELDQNIKVGVETIICADTNLNKDRLAALKIKIANTYPNIQFEFEDKIFHITLEEAIRRDNARPDGVGENVIFKQWLEFQQLFGEKYVPRSISPMLPKAVMCDIDGTLALMQDRSPFEWKKVGNDELNTTVYSILLGLQSRGYEIVLMSGRDEVCRSETEKWLSDHCIPYSYLFMRKENDMRKDTIVKKEMFFDYVADNFDVKMVIDDRPSVCKMWYSLGLKLIHVGCPWQDF